MRSLLVRFLLACLCIYFVISVVVGYDCERSLRKKCAYGLHFQLISADCIALDLNTVPDNLKDGIEALSLSQNRLRELSCTSFDHYTNLKHLYLDDNMISHVPEGVFHNLEDLEIIDLSNNALRSLPIDFLLFPNLRTVYASHNYFSKHAFDSWENITGKVNIQCLSLAFSDLTEIPPLDKFKELTTLNLSGNPLKTISPLDLASACKLTSLDLNYIDHLFEENFCGCQLFETYLTQNGISLVPPYQLNCTEKALTDTTDCSSNDTNHDVKVAVKACKYYKKAQTRNEIHERNKSISIFTVLGTITFIATVIAILLKCKLNAQKKLLNRFLNHAMTYRTNSAGGSVNLINRRERVQLVETGNAFLTDAESAPMNDDVSAPVNDSDSASLKNGGSAV